MSKKDQSLNNLLYFEASSMKALYECLKSWQDENLQSFLRLNIQQDHDRFCCIALLSSRLLMQEDLEENARTKYEESMARFQRKAIRMIVGEEKFGASVEFVDDIIPAEKI